MRARGDGNVGALEQADNNHQNERRRVDQLLAVVCRHPLDTDTEPSETRNGRLKEDDSTPFTLVGDLHKSDARRIVDAEVDEFPIDAMVTVDHARLSSDDALSD